MMTMEEVIEILWNLYDVCVKVGMFESDEEKTALRNIITDLKPEHRDAVIAHRDKALTEGAMDWAVYLSHVIAAMSDPAFWEQREGLHGKYILRKADGTPLNPDAKYFVLRYDAEAEHGNISRHVLQHYCDSIRAHTPELATQLTTDLKVEFTKAWDFVVNVE